MKLCYLWPELLQVWLYRWTPDCGDSLLNWWTLEENSHCPQWTSSRWAQVICDGKRTRTFTNRFVQFMKKMDMLLASAELTVTLLRCCWTVFFLNSLLNICAFLAPVLFNSLPVNDDMKIKTTLSNSKNYGSLFPTRNKEKLIATFNLTILPFFFSLNWEI